MALSPDARALFLEYVSARAKELQPKLQPHPRHPRGRNAYAHLFLAVKSVMGKSYHKCDNTELSKMISIIDRVCENPN